MNNWNEFAKVVEIVSILKNSDLITVSSSAENMWNSMSEDIGDPTEERTFYFNLRGESLEVQCDCDGNIGSISLEGCSDEFVDFMQDVINNL